jgi:hypothetical protein
MGLRGHLGCTSVAEAVSTPTGKVEESQFSRRSFHGYEPTIHDQISICQEE